jgi:transposase
MDLDLTKIPDDARITKQDLACLIDLVEQKYQEKIAYLEERVRLLQNEIFGRRTEKHYPQDHLQMPLFPNAGQEPSNQDLSNETIVIAEHSRKKKGRKPLPADLPRIDVIHDIPEEEKVCECGSCLSRIGQEVCEKLDYVPAKIRVLRHIRYKYACKSCEGVESSGPAVKIAPPVEQLIPKSMVSEGLLAHIIVSKFADGLPLYRQQKMFARLGIELPRATMANWAIAAAKRCGPLIDLMQNDIRGGPLINIDESPLQVLNEPGRANTTKSYMWVFCGGTPEHPCILFRYHPTRSGQVALSFLNDYRGFIQSDGFTGYDHLGKNKGIVLLACWAHVRRKFVEVVKARKKVRGGGQSPKGLADEALEFIGKLYLIEKQCRQAQMSPAQIYEVRKLQSRPVLRAFKHWLDEKQPLTPPKGLLGQAIGYTLSLWSRLVVYIEDGRLKPDNNAAENAIRPFVLGRKNFLFAGNPRGADACATFFSLIETAKANGLEPFSYLRYVFERLPLLKTPDEYRLLLPQYVDRSAVNGLRS